jgi:hypothetical protein
VITSDVLTRVFRVQYQEQQGTMFTVDHMGRQYLVSANHIFKGASGKFTLEIFHSNGWKPLHVSLTGHAASGDVSVIAAPIMLTSTELKAEPSSAGLVYGQDVYFLGFPYGLFGDFPEVNSGYPLPFAKKAILSMMDAQKKSVMYLDGINNVGFSGGPVAFAVNGETNVWRIAGVISGYLAASEMVSDGKVDIGPRYSANTGLIKASPIKLAMDLIEANPNGFAH